MEKLAKNETAYFMWVRPGITVGTKITQWQFYPCTGVVAGWEEFTDLNGSERLIHILRSLEAAPELPAFRRDFIKGDVLRGMNYELHKTTDVFRTIDELRQFWNQQFEKK